MPRNPNIAFINTLRSALADGVYTSGTLLPSERKLAADFNVGRGVVRNALRQLAAEGVVSLIPHRGVSVNSAVSERRFKRFMLCCDHISSNPGEMLSLLSEICLAAAKMRAEVLVSFSESGALELNMDDLAWRIQQDELQGVMIVENCDPEIAQMLQDRAIPHVMVNQEIIYTPGCCRVDHRAVGRMAGARLLQTRYQNYAVVSGSLDSLVFKEMLAGFRGALAEEEVILTKDAVFELPPTFSEENYRQLVEFLRQMPRPLALFAMRDSRAEFVYRACQELDLQIPADVAVIGYDNISWQEGAAVGLTTIRQPMDELAENAVKMLKAWCESSKQLATATVCGEIIERRSLPENA